LIFTIPNDPKAINALKHNWRAEVETSRVYRDLAKRETDQKRTSILLRMAEAEERHATRWAQKLTELGMEPPVLKASLGQCLNRWWNRVPGRDVAIRRMETAEDRHEARYRAQSERALANDPDAQKFLREAALEEKAHARVLNTMTPPPGPRGVLDTILKRERWHGRGGSWVADAIYGRDAARRRPRMAIHRGILVRGRRSAPSLPWICDEEVGPILFVVGVTQSKGVGSARSPRRPRNNKQCGRVRRRLNGAISNVRKSPVHRMSAANPSSDRPGLASCANATKTGPNMPTKTVRQRQDLMGVLIKTRGS